MSDGQSYWSRASTEEGYFRDRSCNPYRSTVVLEKYGTDLGFFSLTRESVIVDLACGTGSETAWLAKRHPELHFVGLDQEPRFVAAAIERYGSTANVSYECGDLRHPPPNVLSMQPQRIWMSQTLSWLPWKSAFIEGLRAFEHVTGVLLSTLAWAGPFDSEVTHLVPRPGTAEVERLAYNVFSLQGLASDFRDIGFRNFHSVPFSMDVDLLPPSEPGLGSYTVRIETGERLTFSGWQVLPWCFVYASMESQPT